ncbi:GNAT family N-acetyltransferase [Microvirga yunnanensis]|uniref:GNAT family N-acetyltransferase n=1 Tax=Microvirga yunnanensis TaxID=2953740 RepID=UPI00359F749A
MADAAVQTAGIDDQSRLVAAIVLAFSVDPAARWTYPAPENYLKHFPDLVWIFGGPAVERRTAHFIGDAQAAALWLAPGVQPDEPHWYLPLIGVNPAQQGKGYGSALLKHALRLCDEDGTLAYLESSNPKNIPLYQRHGFQVLGTIQVGNSPPITPMLRRAG